MNQNASLLGRLKSKYHLLDILTYADYADVSIPNFLHRISKSYRDICKNENISIFFRMGGEIIKYRLGERIVTYDFRIENNLMMLEKAPQENISFVYVLDTESDLDDFLALCLSGLTHKQSVKKLVIDISTNFTTGKEFLTKKRVMQQLKELNSIYKIFIAIKISKELEVSFFSIEQNLSKKDKKNFFWDFMCKYNTTHIVQLNLGKNFIQEKNFSNKEQINIKNLMFHLLSLRSEIQTTTFARRNWLVESVELCHYIKLQDEMS